MKLKRFFLALLFVLGMAAYAHAQETEVFVVSYVDSIPILKSRGVMPALKKKLVTYRMDGDTVIKSRKEKFIAYFDKKQFVSDGMLCCLKLAMNAWEDKLDIRTPVRFFFCVSDKLGSDVAVSTKVAYSKISNAQSVADNLYAQTRPAISVNDSIIINSNIDWKTMAGDVFHNGSICLVNYLNRNIARILGFGCSLVKRNSNIGFSVMKTPSTFDNLLFDGDVYLNSLKSASSRYLNAFFAKKISLKSNAFEYKMYNTGNFIDNISGCFFSLGYDNILEYQMSSKSDVLPINNETLDVLEQVGWKVNRHEYEINCDKTDKLGYGSLFDTLNFSIKHRTSSDVISADWQYQVYDSSMKNYKTLLSRHGSSFNVAPSVYGKSLDIYHCVQSRVVAIVNGVEYYFPLTLDAAPQINDVRISGIKKIDSNRYQFNLDIDQKGATGGYVTVNDETGSMHQYEYTGKQISISGLYVGMNVYLRILLSNDYAVSTRDIFGDIYNGGNSIVHKTVAVQTTDWEHNVSLSGQKLHDGNALLLDIGKTANPVDSIEWYLYAGGYLKKLSFTRGNNHVFNFVVSKANLDMEIRKSSEDKSTEYVLGKSWGRFSSSSEDQYFMAKVFMHDINGSFYSYYKFTDFSFEVLPSEPIVEVTRVYTERDEGVDWIKAELNLKTENFSDVFFCVSNFGDWGDTYMYDPCICNGNVPDVVNLYFANVTDQFYCISYNEYGYYKGKIHNLSATPIDATKESALNIQVDNGKIIIVDDDTFNVYIYSLDGILQYQAISVRNFVKNLNKGCYILKLCDEKLKTNISKKILIN